MGYSSFEKEYPPNSFKSDFIDEFVKAVDSLPKLIPATQRNKKVKVYYSIPVIWPSSQNLN